ncbi:MAG: alpha/beta fold hydrolase [Saprospiraceae bacterium]|nr:alpha/beta fold hydrolase [Saprospiraceae bacterium]
MFQKLLYKTYGLGLNLWSLVSPKAAAYAAYRIFCRPPKPNVRPKELEFLNTARQVRSEIAGYPVVEYHWGPESGPRILLSYGWHYNAGRWRHFVPYLVETGFHVVAYDPPGHGLNPGNFCNVLINSEIMIQLLNKYGPVEAVVAHSFGGAGMVRALNRLPAGQRPRRAVIMASFSHADSIFKEYRDNFGMWPGLYARLLQVIESIIGAQVHTFDFAYMSNSLEQVQALLIYDPADPVTPFANAHRYHAYWPKSRLLQGSGGHHLGKPEITEMVLKFAAHGEYPAQAEERKQVVEAEHELVRYFAGVDL